MKKLVSVVLVCMLLSTMPVFAASTPSDWANSFIATAKNATIISQDYEAEWQTAITREAFCELAYNTMVALGKEPTVPEKSPFTDTENKAIAALNSMEIILGKAEGVFAPADLLTREEAATILWRMSDKLGCAVTNPNITIYSDHSDIATWAQSPVYVVYALGIMQGTDTGFSPKANYTVEQAVTTMVRLYNVTPR
ncbi:MAG: S-layer homology domain-containing protein [Ruminococcaceae bacterium]|nr:S-layer homology domain-containing protein [Oscillospiraceae bacterium]